MLSVMLCCLATSAHALTSDSDEDTILVEKQILNKISYSTALKSLAKHIFQFDIDSVFSGGNNSRSAVIRNFSEFAERTKYNFRLKHDKVEVKFTLNF